MNHLEMWSRYSIFNEEDIVLRLLKCVLIRDTCKRRYHDSVVYWNHIYQDYQTVRVKWGSYNWVCSLKNNWSNRSYGLTMSHEVNWFRYSYVHKVCVKRYHSRDIMTNANLEFKP